MNENAEAPKTAVSVEEKLKIQAQLFETAGYLVKLFGQEDAAKMLRAAARMVLPRTKAAT